MEIFNMVRGHFALFIGQPFSTPVQERPFHIEEVSTMEGDWQITLYFNFEIEPTLGEN